MAEPRKTLLGWPAKTQYHAAVQDSPSVFRDLRLRRATVARLGNGMPEAVTGQNAVVFRLVQPNGRNLALRCFSHAPADGARRYRAIPGYLRRHPCPPLVTPEWLQEGILVDGAYWPTVLMPWAAGDSLDHAVSSRLSAPEGLARLAESWLRAVQQLREASFAHGDLQHGNALVDDNFTMRLIDLDGAWFPEGQPWHASEAGHPHYRHPRRVPGMQGLAIDAFPATVIYLSLLALAADPRLWTLNNGDNLIFTREDFEHPRRTPVWRRLRRSPDRRVRSLTAGLADDCTRAPDDSRRPDQLLADIRYKR